MYVWHLNFKMQELMGRPIRLKFSERDADGSENKEETPTQENSEEP